MIKPRMIGYQENVAKMIIAGNRKSHPVKLFLMRVVATMKTSLMELRY